MKKLTLLLICTLLFVLVSDDAEARSRKRRRRRYQGPPPTHPVILWSKTLSESKEPKERRIAAFKLSQYSQNIFQDGVINTLLSCMNDEDMQIRVLCTKALGRAGRQSHAEKIRTALLDHYKEQTSLRNTVVRTFIVRKDDSVAVQDKFMTAAKSVTDPDELLVLLSYFEQFGKGTPAFVDNIVELYGKQKSTKLKRAVVKVMSERAEGQDKVVETLAQCSQSSDTPLALTCLAGLQLQAKKDARAWSAVENTVTSDDPDVMMASLDVINALPDTPNASLAKRLVRILNDIEDIEVQEKAVLALGVCGDSSEPIVKALKDRLSNTKLDESVRIASALIIGKQGASFPEAPRAILTECSKSGSSQSLRSACTLGLNELELKAKANASNISKARTPSSDPSIAEDGTPAAKDGEEEDDDEEQNAGDGSELRAPTEKETKLQKRAYRRG